MITGCEPVTLPVPPIGINILILVEHAVPRKQNIWIHLEHQEPVILEMCLFVQGGMSGSNFYFSGVHIHIILETQICLDQLSIIHGIAVNHQDFCAEVL